jgi:acyl phosphate:glycerol-3-phosphate acyltransferase
MIFLLLIVSYLLGSIPFGLIITRAAGLGDIRAVGSGNIGATNVLRTGKKGLAAATVFLDGFKGSMAVLVAQHLVARHFVGYPTVFLAGFAVLLGHLFPSWLGFKGGKGVATGLGVLLAEFFPVGLITCVAWLIAAFALRRSSVASLAAFAIAPLAALAFGHRLLALSALAIAVLVYWRHSPNIARLRSGTEPRIGQKT